MFFSPEAVEGDTYRGKPNDIWACGITLYYMLTGNYPYTLENNNYKKLHADIAKKEPEYPENLLGTPVHDLMIELLRKKPEERISIAEIKQHPWITKDGAEPLEE